ncbi:unnamed protein product, partial [marine sediment metagenome]
MPETDFDNSKIHFNKILLPIYLLAGLFSISFSGIYILVMPLSLLFWPGEPYHALEMGILITSMFWVMSGSGIFFGRLIDKYSRKRIFFMMLKTMLSKTNLIVLIEGIFTNVFLGSLTILFLPYIQGEPHNFAPFTTAVFLASFGLIAGILGKIILARLSDKLCHGKEIRRLYFIIFA